MGTNDNTWLKELFSLYSNNLTSFAYTIVRDPDLARDVVQDVFIYTWEHREQIRAGDAVRGYLYRATRNRALNVLKHERAESRARDVEEFAMRGVTASSADEQLETNELARLTRSTINAMTPRLREIFLLSKAHGLTNPEIAAALGVSVETVKSQLSRAVKALEEALKA